ncbi:MAG TPA: helix-turn-helix domain-containing protein [Spirillospora sp.]|nr:helix-turn-helix domain-containing protein [Spirillospora sp.]
MDDNGWSELADVLALVSRRWMLPVMDELSRGIRSHNDLARNIGIDNQQLDRALRPLVRRNFIHRKVHAASPPIRVYYFLTPKGRAILTAFTVLRATIAAALSAEADESESKATDQDRRENHSLKVTARRDHQT